MKLNMPNKNKNKKKKKKKTPTEMCHGYASPQLCQNIK